MIVILRLLGVFNAAVWLGAAIFFTFGVAPVFFTPETKRLLGETLGGITAILVLERYFALNYLCGAIALVHQFAGWVYLGRQLQRFTWGLLLGILGVGFVSGLVLQPKLQKLHQAKYGYTRTTAGFARGATPAPAQRAAAEASFKTWHAVSQVINLLTLGGLAVYFWRLANPSDGTRFSSTAKFRS